MAQKNGYQNKESHRKQELFKETTDSILTRAMTAKTFIEHRI